MRRWLGVVFVAALLVGACGSDDPRDAPVVTDAPAPEDTSMRDDDPALGDASAMLVADGDRIVRIDGGATETVAHLAGIAAVAYGAGTGLIAAEVDGALVVVGDDGPAAVDAGQEGIVHLYDVAAVDGVAHALYGVRRDVDGEEPSGIIVLASLAGGERRDLAAGFAPEFHTAAGSLAGDVVVLSAFSDLTESVWWVTLDGGDPPAWSPTDDLEYNAPPLVMSAVLSPDASTVAWLSGPDWDGATGATVGGWEVVVADLTGRERHRLPIDGADGEPIRIDYDGERVLVSRRAGEERAPALVIDLASGSTAALPVAGTATFDR